MLYKVCQVKELENKLKERTQEFERHSAMLNQKAIELENKLQIEGGNQGFQMLQRKIEELELKLRQQEQQEYMLPACSADKSGTTSNERKTWSRVQTPGQTDPPSLRSLNTTNRAINQESVLLKGTDTLHQIRRRRGLQSIGTENTFLASSPLLDKRILSSESTKGRHIDQSKALSRLTRSTKPAATVHRAFSGSNLYKDQLPGNKDKNNKSKFWLR